MTGNLRSVLDGSRPGAARAASAGALLAGLTAAFATGCTGAAGEGQARVDIRGSSSMLAALPDGEERRRFILDCTGCHTFRPDIAYPGGAARTEPAWSSMAADMIARFGPSSGFPVIGPDRDAGAIAQWLARSLPAPPPPAQTLPASAIGRAEFREYVLPEPQDLPHDLAVQAT